MRQEFIVLLFDGFQTGRCFVRVLATILPLVRDRSRCPDCVRPFEPRVFGIWDSISSRWPETSPRRRRMVPLKAALIGGCSMAFFTENRESSHASGVLRFPVASCSPRLVVVRTASVIVVFVCSNRSRFRELFPLDSSTVGDLGRFELFDERADLVFSSCRWFWLSCSALGLTFSRFPSPPNSAAVASSCIFWERFGTGIRFSSADAELIRFRQPRLRLVQAASNVCCLRRAAASRTGSVRMQVCRSSVSMNRCAVFGLARAVRSDSIPPSLLTAFGARTIFGVGGRDELCFAVASGGFALLSFRLGLT